MKRVLFLLSLVLIPLLSYAQVSDYDIPVLWNYDTSLSKTPFMLRNQIGVYVSAGNAVTEMYWQYKIDELCEMTDYSDDIHCGLPIHFVGLGAEYYFNRDSKLKFGISGGIEISRYEHGYSYKPMETKMFSENNSIRAKLWYVIPTVRYDWYRNGNLKCYSSASVGVARISYEHSKELYNAYKYHDEEEYFIGDQTGETKEWKEHSTVCAYQAVPLGCELGNRWFNYFIEFGYGYKGKIITGIRYSF